MPKPPSPDVFTEIEFAGPSETELVAAEVIVREYIREHGPIRAIPWQRDPVFGQIVLFCDRLIVRWTELRVVDYACDGDALQQLAHRNDCVMLDTLTSGDALGNGDMIRVARWVQKG